MSVARRAIASLLLLSALAGMSASPSAAAWESPKLVSKNSLEQADEASEVAISGNGEFVVFRGAIGGLKGVFRKDLSTGAIVPVVVGSEYSNPPISRSSAPSISADGRYVSFTTTAQLDASEDPQPESSDVYVADMATTPPTYEIASALDGCDPRTSSTPCGLTYESAGGSLGSSAAPRVGLSASGREVAFVTLSPSNFEAAGTPERQVLLRNLETDATTLVSVERDPLTGSMTTRPVSGGAVMASNGQRTSGASISADGSTVAWPGTDISSQTQTFPGEETESATYNEPLWRRVAEGPAAPTRRIVGGPDGPYSQLISEQPFCTGSGGEGWLTRPSSVDPFPQLSADGRTVALIGQPNVYADVYLVDMSAGLTRGQASRKLTQALPVKNPGNVCGEFGGSGIANLPGSADIEDVGISPDGTEVSFVTARQLFPLSPPHLADPPPASLGLSELYVLDLASETIERVTGGPNGAASTKADGAGGEQGAASPCFSENGRLLAFASQASNLFVGDGNGASDAFVSEDHVASVGPGRTTTSAAPVNALPRPQWKLILSARSLPGGRVRLVAVVPGSGRVRTRFAAAVSPRGKVKNLGVAQRKARAGGPVVLQLKLPPRFRPLAHTHEGLYANARVAFRGPGGRPLHGNLVIRFHAHRAKPRKGAKR
jgi:hypothetical protein